MTNSPDPDTIPGTQTLAEDHTLVLSTGNGNTIAIGGIPGLATDYKVTLSANAGATLSLGGNAGLTLVTGDGINDVTMTFTGSLAAINSALQGSTVTPTADFNGPVTLTLNWDDQGAANGTPQPAMNSTVTINVTPVNDAPSFTKGANLSVAQNAGAQTVPGWVTAISTGPSDESSQTVTFHTTVTGNPGLFAVAPQIAADGTLTYTPAPLASGTAIIEVYVTDNGTAANGGVDTSAVQTFTISVGAVNHAPSDIGLAGTTVIENSTVGTTVGTLSTIDVDGDTVFTYQLIAGIGGDDNGAFAIVGNTLKTSGAFDFETKSSYTIRVQSTDGGGLSTVKVFTITVVDANERPSIDTTPTIMLPDLATKVILPSTVQVSALLTYATDSESPSTVGVAITGLHGTGGIWQISPNGAPNTWTTLSAVSGSTALLMNRTEFIRFVPKKGFTGFAGISFKAWDGQVGTAGTRVDPAANPVVFSSGEDTAWVQVGKTKPDVDNGGHVVLPKTKEDGRPTAATTAANLLGFLKVDYSTRTRLGLAVTGTTRQRSLAGVCPRQVAADPGCFADERSSC